MARKMFTREDLNEKQSAFVDAYLEMGASRQAATQAVMQVYGYDKRTAQSASWRLLKNEKVRDVIVSESAAQFPALAAEAIDVIRSILNDGVFHGQKVNPNTGLKAALSVIERGLGAVATQHEHTVNHELGQMTRKELEAALIREFNKLNPKDVAAIASAAGVDIGKVIDVEPEPVAPKLQKPLTPIEQWHKEKKAERSAARAKPYGYKGDGTAKKKPGPKRVERPVRAEDKIAEIKRAKLRAKLSQEADANE